MTTPIGVRSQESRKSSQETVVSSYWNLAERLPRTFQVLAMTAVFVRLPRSGLPSPGGQVARNDSGVEKGLAMTAVFVRLPRLPSIAVRRAGRPD